MVRRSIPFLATTIAASALASAVACHSSGTAASGSGGGGDDGGAVAEAGMPFQADPPTVYVAKVKNVLVGLPPTDAEVQAVQADPTQLAPLIDQWMQTPQYTAKMLRFFQLAFQQTQVTYTDFADQVYPREVAINSTTIPPLMQDVQESFARTMLQLVASGQPLTQGATTTQLMMTTALKELYAFLDVWEVDDDSNTTDYFKQANPKLKITVGSAQGPIPIAETLDPTSPNYMHWYDPDVATADSTMAGCTEDPIVYPADASTLHYLLYGSLAGYKGTTGNQCPNVSGSSSAPQLQTGDFTDWSMVTIRAPNAGESTTTFYDLPTLRQANELVLDIPRVGFFSTPAFFANWQTNTSNTMRVTMNQTFIVALGSMVDGTDTTTPPGTPGLDTTHVTEAACYNCHKVLDPSRSILAASWSWNYHSQLDSTWSSQPGMFAFRGVVTPVKTLGDFGSALATHPYFAPAWVQKMCYWANSSACDPSDPAFEQIVKDFTSSNFSWNAMVKELLASPIVTNASESVTAATNGEIVAVARRDHFCAALNDRLGFDDVCGLASLYAKGTASTQTIPEIVSGLPSDGYGRGAVAPVLPNDPTLFFRAATENICETVAKEVIDVPTSKQTPGVKQWSSDQYTAAIGDFVSTLMGLTSGDPRTAQATTLLTQHYASALAQKGTSATAALQSTFVAACMAPSFVSIGM
ncbi:MAG TPA: hypothetical protein VGG39_06885 [Polyangiaceae bacterium]|jgi:hypothetical protein